MKIHFPDGLLRNQMVSVCLGSKRYLILTSQISMRGPIVGHEARNLDAE